MVTPEASLPGYRAGHGDTLLTGFFPDRRARRLRTSSNQNIQLETFARLAKRLHYWRGGVIVEVGMGAAYQFNPKRERYSPEVMKALTISARRKSPPNWLSLFSQN